MLNFTFDKVLRNRYTNVVNGGISKYMENLMERFGNIYKYMRSHAFGYFICLSFFSILFHRLLFKQGFGDLLYSDSRAPFFLAPIAKLITALAADISIAEAYNGAFVLSILTIFIHIPVSLLGFRKRMFRTNKALVICVIYGFKTLLFGSILYTFFYFLAAFFDGISFKLICVMYWMLITNVTRRDSKFAKNIDAV